MVQFINRKVFQMSNDSHSTYFKQRMEELTKANEQKRLKNAYLSCNSDTKPRLIIPT